MVSDSQGGHQLMARCLVIPLGVLALWAGVSRQPMGAAAWVPAHLVSSWQSRGLPRRGAEATAGDAHLPRAACPGGSRPCPPLGRGALLSGTGGSALSVLACRVGALGHCWVRWAAVLLGALAARARPWRSNRPAQTGASSRRGTRISRALGVNPATAWPAGNPRFTTEYKQTYDLSDPKGSFTRIGEMILKEMTSELPDLYEMPLKEVAWVTESLEYNTQGGKMNRGLIVVETGCEVMKHQGRTPTNHDLCRFAVLGWAVEFLQACMLMADDMMDGSLTRRGQECWYKRDNVGLLATNDFLMIEMFVYKVIKRHFGQEEYFPWLIDLFLETTFQTEIGQLLDSQCEVCELEELTTKRWELLVKYKTAFYSFYLPVALAMVVAGVRDRKAFDVARELLVLMGVYFQAQDDYLDAFACPEVLGKVGTDIADKKCSWLFAHAYHEIGTDEARELLDQHYGKCEVGSKEEEMIKNLYRETGLSEVFSQKEQKIERKLEEFRHKVDEAGLPFSIFERFFKLIHKRSK